MCKVEIIPKFIQGELKYEADFMFICLVSIPAQNTWNPYLIQADNPANITVSQFLDPIQSTGLHLFSIWSAHLGPYHAE